MNRKALFSLVGVITLLGVAGVGFAATGGLTAAEPTLSEQEAMNIAEERVGGTAQTIEQENEGGGPVYEVLVQQSDGEMKEVEIDGDSGEVLEVENADKEENEENEDEADEN
ncbi:PepSY domain-containing protein [Halobium salinum]|uniref:PepSY domain-containing protein n=1 Tax=Halobium salinum TaxID=1364940 RepID=A0ABD5PHZ5_9EURY|nr:PepSY domain-containing protein [Halobium salinum]